MYVWTLPFLLVEALVKAGDLSQVLPLCFRLCQQRVLIIELVLPIDLRLTNLLGIRVVSKRDWVDEQLLGLGELTIVLLLALINCWPHHLSQLRTVAGSLALELLRILHCGLDILILLFISLQLRLLF